MKVTKEKKKRKWEQIDLPFANTYQIILANAYMDSDIKHLSCIVLDNSPPYYSTFLEKLILLIDCLDFKSSI